jgi:sulfite reductase (NADPH) hemoprotein beta-component
MIETRFAELRPLFGGADQVLLAEIRAAFAPPACAQAPTAAYEAPCAGRSGVPRLGRHQPAAHRDPQYAIVTISLKAHGETPGDATADQMRLLADLAETYGHGDIRISHEQNVILPHVHKSDLPALHAALREAGLATANVGLLSDIIACPGMDYCALATARSIPVAQEIACGFRRSSWSRCRAAEDQDLGLHQRLRPSPCRPYRHSGPRSRGGGKLPDHARRRRHRSLR